MIFYIILDDYVNKREIPLASLYVKKTDLNFSSPFLIFT